MLDESLVAGDALTCLQQMPDAICDAGVTSPPYNKQEANHGWLVQAVKYKNASDKQNEAAYQQGQIAVLNELYRVMKPGGSFFYNHKVRAVRGEMLHPIMWLSQTHWSIRQEIVWDRRIAANIRGWRFWQVDERIYWLQKPARTGARGKIGRELESRHAKLSSVWRFPPARDNPHPAPFPLILPVRAISAVLPDAPGLVIDPYCGSGTTLVAAKLLGHKWLGIDVSSEYLKMSRARLDRCEGERKVADAELALHQVQGSFRERKEKGMGVGRFSPLSGRAAPAATQPQNQPKSHAKSHAKTRAKESPAAAAHTVAGQVNQPDLLEQAVLSTGADRKHLQD